MLTTKTVKQKKRTSELRMCNTASHSPEENLKLFHFHSLSFARAIHIDERCQFFSFKCSRRLCVEKKNESKKIRENARVHDFVEQRANEKKATKTNEK